MKTLMGLPDSIVRAATHSEPHRLAGYLREVAVAFSQFYNHCRIVGEEEKLAAARLQLARATALVLCNGTNGARHFRSRSDVTYQMKP